MWEGYTYAQTWEDQKEEKQKKKSPHEHLFSLTMKISSFFFGWKLLQCRWFFAYSRSSHYTLMLCESWRKRAWVSEALRLRGLFYLEMNERGRLVGSALMLINSQVFLWVIQKDAFKMLSEKAVKGERERVSERRK